MDSRPLGYREDRLLEHRRLTAQDRSCVEASDHRLIAGFLERFNWPSPTAKRSPVREVNNADDMTLPVRRSGLV